MGCCCPFFQGEGTAEVGLGGPSTWEVEDEWNGGEESEEEEEVVIAPKGDLGTRLYSTNCMLQSQPHTSMGMRLEHISLDSFSVLISQLLLPVVLQAMITVVEDWE